MLGGTDLTPRVLYDIGYNLGAKIKVNDEAWERVRAARAVIDKIVNSGEVKYGINTGFGSFATTIIEPDKLSLLQENLIRSHAAGVGPPLSIERTRMLFALRINVLARGHSGVREETLRALINVFNAGIMFWVPEQGTVGASGDLAPLSHLALGMLGEGKAWNPTTGAWEASAADVLEAHGLPRIRLAAKEGLALINGTQMVTSLGAEAVERAALACVTADVVAAMTLEGLKGTRRAFMRKIHAVRPHKGQSVVAQRMRALLHTSTHPSELYADHANCGRVQDSYTLRCIPQVHGVCNDTVAWVEDILESEVNSATDNPMVFADEGGEVLSGGNFHGEYPAKALDYLAIGVHELASISERRIERMCNPALSDLPAFLVDEGGLNSGFMIAHCTAAALVSENKVLTHPASVDSISTSAAKEDHVSMGGMAARKALQVVANVERVLAIELLAGCQALDFSAPLRSTEVLHSVHDAVRAVAKTWDADRFMSPDIEAVTELITSGKIWELAKPAVSAQIKEEIEWDAKIASGWSPEDPHAIM